MKKIKALILCLGFFTLASACDICGCGVGGSYIGILPEFTKRIVGIRYRYNSLYSHIGAGGATTYLTAHEHYSTAELWGGFMIRKKFMVMATLPYAFNDRNNQGVTQTKNGIGDISINGYYQLLNKRNTVFSGKKLLVQSFWIGGGIKLPTGEYNPKDKSVLANNTNLFQLGTASVDYTVNAMYDIRLQDAGINIAASYKMNGTNKYHYSYGNKLNTTAQFYYKWRIKNKITIAPNAGLMYETSGRDRDNGFSVDLSGGHLLAGTAGLEAVYKRVVAGINFQTPLAQNLAGGFVKANNRAMVHVGFVF